MRLFCLVLILSISPTYGESLKVPIRFGLTAVVVTENIRFLDEWSQYLEQKTGYKIEFVLRKSYREVMDLLESGSIQFAWICGYPYTQKRSPEFLQLLTIPVYRGAPRYYSYIIVHKNSTYKNFSDLKDKSFAFSDPDSNSGFLYPLTLINKQGSSLEKYFRLSFYTFNHAETIQAVAEQVVDGGAVDSYIWEYLAITNPELTKKTRIIKKSPSFGFPPIVARLDNDPKMTKLIKMHLQDMDQDKTGKKLLERLKLDKFSYYPDSIFNEIRAMSNTIQNLERAQYPSSLIK